ncbi:Protein CBG28071 [Caenorhabditis briggsae]|uniref:Protein CBG28071 n=1 Tax=Caenorhabditis briggsae TaxID=6238 RepID=B6IGR1_CAEBR|nr:Protein CBG28071 [Caenorhabditis briggsae]CAR99091.1 Protein CBG28071 [Caenorhabditis briggsae]
MQPSRELEELIARLGNRNDPGFPCVGRQLMQNGQQGDIVTLGNGYVVGEECREVFYREESGLATKLSSDNHDSNWETLESKTPREKAIIMACFPYRIEKDTASGKMEFEMLLNAIPKRVVGWWLPIENVRYENLHKTIYHF